MSVNAEEENTIPTIPESVETRAAAAEAETEADSATGAAAAAETPVKPVSATFVFNQYYWDFIKKIKDVAKAKRDTDDHAKKIHRALKQNYAIFDKLSDEPLAFFKSTVVDSGVWKAYQEAGVETLATVFETEPFASAMLFKDLTLGTLYTLLQSSSVSNQLLLHQYLTLFGILSNPLTDVHTLLSLMKQFKVDTDLKAKLEALKESSLGLPLIRLYTLFESQLKTGAAGGNDPFGENGFFKEIEDTTLGKLAKEILQDINVDELQKSLSPDMLNGNFMNMFSGVAAAATGSGSGESGGTGGAGGLASIISTVSQKMVSKMTSGEIQQDDLLKDAMTVASKLPSMLPGGLGNDLSKMGDLLSMFSGMGGDKKKKHRSSKNKKDDGFDISSLMNLVSGMNLGGAGGQNIKKKDMNRPASQGSMKTRLSSEMKRQKLAERLRKQLDERQAKTSKET